MGPLEIYKKMVQTGNISLMQDLLALRKKYAYEVCSTIPRKLMLGLIREQHNIPKDDVINFMDDVGYAIKDVDMSVHLEGALGIEIMARLGKHNVSVDMFLIEEFPMFDYHHVKIVLIELSKRERLNYIWAETLAGIINTLGLNDDLQEAASRCCLILDGGSVYLEHVMENIKDEHSVFGKNIMSAAERLGYIKENENETI